MWRMKFLRAVLWTLLGVLAVLPVLGIADRQPSRCFAEKKATLRPSLVARCSGASSGGDG